MEHYISNRTAGPYRNKQNYYAFRLCYAWSQLLLIPAPPLDPSLSSPLRRLGIGFHRSSGRSCRGGKAGGENNASLVLCLAVGVISAQASDDFDRSSETRSVDSRYFAPGTAAAAAADVALSFSPDVLCGFEGCQFCQPYSCQCSEFRYCIVTPSQHTQSPQPPPPSPIPHAIQSHK